jgi:hypothetical protein
LKVAILSTPANIEFAQQFVDQSPTDHDITHYFKRGKLCQKRHIGGKQSLLNRLALLKDLRAEHFDHFILVEWPHARTKVLPYYALLAFLSKARRKSMLLQDGNTVPITDEIVVRLVGELMFVAIKFAVIFPLLLMNLIILIAVAIGVDLVCWPRSKSVTALAKNSVDSSAG